MKNALKCISCNKEITNDGGSTKFMCPNCHETEIIRCSSCRKTAARYKCKNCGFEGPN
ncbi:MAG: zinc finger domain-containing protein [Candidatus Nanoarchaeia archaeon]|nr:zinc finger domain-containing protein [Candidatus Nanoarchaeia archaeon]